LRSTREGRERVEEALAADIARFEAKRSAEYESASSGALSKAIGVLGTVLTYNFFVVVAFFLWFVVGVAFQLLADDATVIGAFRSVWDVLILPLLSTHMALTFLSFGLEKVTKR